MAPSKPEKLIPMIRITRKLSSCNPEQQLKIMQKLPQMFSSHGVSALLRNIIIRGLCHRSVYEKIPTSLYDEIQTLLPMDNELDLTDSVYESRLVETPDDPENDGKRTSKRKKLPMSLLRIPTDLQYHLLHFLPIDDLKILQTVCRALCILARNPSALYSLLITRQNCQADQFANECYSQLKKLEINSMYRMFRLSQSSQLLIGNDKWGGHVVDFCVDNRREMIDVRNLVAFRKLKKCKIWWSDSILRNGQIASYHTLKELTLGRIQLTEEIVDHIRKHRNLEKLSLHCLLPNPNRLDYPDPISLPKLRTFSYEIERYGFREFQRFLIGSNPETIININAHRHDEWLYASDEILEYPIPKIFTIKEFHIFCREEHFLQSLNRWLSSPLSKAQCRNYKLFEQINFNISKNMDDSYSSIVCIVEPLITLFQHTNKSKLNLEWRPPFLGDSDMKSMVDLVLKAPFGTFTEIRMYFEFFGLLKHHMRMEEDDMIGDLYISILLKSLGEKESDEKDHQITRNVVMECLDDVEEWLIPWLVFNENRMKQIGLRNLDIEFSCSLKPDFEWMKTWRGWDDEMQTKADRFRAIYEQMGNEWVKEKVEKWSKCARPYIRSKEVPGGDGYTVTLSLRLGNSIARAGI